ncbi:MAG: hypothetical protein KAI47_05935 [Deltaproteobacteria bacterium]|nr:hypothetical protein [Deltaproteobacteria bacterium]
MKTVLLEALAVATLDATGFGDAMKKVGRDLACDMAKAGAGGASSDFSHANDLDTFVQIVGGKSLIPCPQ